MIDLRGTRSSRTSSPPRQLFEPLYGQLNLLLGGELENFVLRAATTLTTIRLPVVLRHHAGSTVFGYQATLPLEPPTCSRPTLTSIRTTAGHEHCDDSACRWVPT